MPRNTPSKGSCTRFPAFNSLMSGLANPFFFLAFCEHSFAHLRYISYRSSWYLGSCNCQIVATHCCDV